MNFPSGDWNSFQPLSGPEYAKDQQAIAERNQLGQLQIDTKRQELETENALAPYKLKAADYANQQAGEENDLKKVDYENQMIGEVAQRAQAADPGDAPNVWDDGMQALADKGIGTANQYIGHYRPDLAEKVYGTYGGAEASGGGRGSRAAGGGAGATGGNLPYFDSDAFERGVQQAPLPQLKQSYENLNRAITGFNNVRDEHGWRTEVKALEDAKILPPGTYPAGGDWNMQYADAHQKIQLAAQQRDIMGARLSAAEMGVPYQSKPLYEPNIQYIGTDQTTGKAQGFDTHTGKPMTISTGAIAPKPSAGVANTLLKQKMWLSVHPNDEAGALQYANGKRSMDPGQIQLSALTEANRELYDISSSGQTVANPEQWVKNRQAEIVQQVTQANGGGAPAALAPARTAPRLSQADIQASIANARAALKRHPDKRGVIVARLKAAGVPTAGF